MRTADCIARFGSKSKLAHVLGISPPSVYTWGEYPPELRQLQLEALTDGELKAEPDCDKFRVPAEKAA